VEIWMQTKLEEIPTVEREAVARVVARMTGIPVEEVSLAEKERLIKMEELIHARMVNQNEAVKSVSSAIRRARAGLRDIKRPIGVFMFMGPTGVGKTELAKSLAEILYGNENALVRLDMSEYMERHSVSRIIGSPPGYVGFDEGGQLTEIVRRRPFSIVLLDEIEKAHHDVFNILLQILDDGRITDNLERTIDFTHTIIIATSNAGSEIIRERATEGTSSNKEFAKILMDKLLRDGIFRPEFVNRFDSIITFDPLNELQIREIAELMIKEIQKKLLAERDRKLEVTDQAVTKLASLGFDPQYGAREMRRVMQEQLENFIAKKVLGDEEDKDTPIVFDVGDIEE